MTQRERDRLMVLKKALKRLIRQRQAAEELKLSERQVRRLLVKLKETGDGAVIHGLRGRRSNRRLAEQAREKAVRILSQEVYRGFGPTLASEYLASKHKLRIGRETLRQLMLGAGLWRGRSQRNVEVHEWRARRGPRGDLVQWDTCEHDWLEGRGEKLYLIHMIDDATSELTARFVRHDSTEENMRLLWSYLECHGRPVAFYTDKASIFQTAPKKNHLLPDEPLPPTQIGRALRELGIGWTPAHSPQAKGRIERSFLTAQDRLVKGLRVSGSYDLGGRQSVFGAGVCALVESTSGGSGCQPDRCAPAPGYKSRSGCGTEPRRGATNRQRLHIPLPGPPLSDCQRGRAAWIAWRCCARRSPVGWFPSSSLSGAISQFPRVSAATQSFALRIPLCRPAQSAAPAQPCLATGPEWDRAPRRHTPVESWRNQSYSHARRTGISSPKSTKERRAKAARPTLAFTQPKASARKLHHPDGATSKSKTPEQRRSRVLAVPIRNGASPVASALGIRLGATLADLLTLTCPPQPPRPNGTFLLGRA